MQTIVLVGTEDVVRAAATMRQAAEEIMRASAHIAEALRTHELAMDRLAEAFADRLAAPEGG